MSKAKEKPKTSSAPWKTRKKVSGLTQLLSAGGKHIATFLQFNEANAQLACAAPELLATLKAACDQALADAKHYDGRPHVPGWYDSARAAIAKAEGGAA